MEEELKELTGQYRAIKNQLSAPDLVGQLLEERERSFAPSKTIAEQQQQAQFISWNQRLMHKNPSRVLDTLQATQSKVADFVDEQTKKLAELEREIQRLEQKKGSLQKEVLQQLNATKQKINKASNRELKKWMGENNITQDRLEGFLADVKTLGIGRSMVNYSELTAWNVMLTGVNVEYNPTYYAAFAAGNIDFGFRDFLGRYKTNRAQSMILGRFGIGDREQKALIFSVFAGTKNNYGAAPTDTVTHQVHLVGYSLEGIWRKDPNTGLVAEIAKTTEPVTGLLRKNSGLQSLWEFSNTANLAISLKGETLLKNTRTRISGVFKKTGATFQSFGLFTYQADQVSWNIKVDQPFWRDKISLVAMLRRNDFTNPFTVKTFKSSTVFKSFQTSIRLPKWPVVSAGYYPGTQLYMIDKEHIRENAYYIINASLLHSYSLGGARMVSSVIYNGYASKGTDSGFIAYAGKNYIATHYVTWRKVQLQGSYSFTDQERMQFSTGEGGVDYSVSGKIRVGGGVKYNHILKGTDYWGSRLQLHVTVGHLGELHLQYEKSFLPTIHRSLYPVEIGRASWSKFF